MFYGRNNQNELTWRWNKCLPIDPYWCNPFFCVKEIPYNFVWVVPRTSVSVPILTCQSVLTVAAIIHDAPCFVACCIFGRFEINCQYFPRSATCSVAWKLRKELTFESNSSFQKCVSNYYGNKHMYFTSIY